MILILVLFFFTIPPISCQETEQIMIDPCRISRVIETQEFATCEKIDECIDGTMEKDVLFLTPFEKIIRYTDGNSKVAPKRFSITSVVFKDFLMRLCFSVISAFLKTLTIFDALSFKTLFISGFVFPLTTITF